MSSENPALFRWTELALVKHPGIIFMNFERVNLIKIAQQTNK
jgi:hypothetical protein